MTTFPVDFEDQPSRRTPIVADWLNDVGDALNDLQASVPTKAPLVSPALTGTPTVNAEPIVTAVVDASGSVTLYANGVEL